MNQAKQSTTVRIVILAVIILGISGWAYWRYILTNPNRVFDRMLSNSLSTTSVTKVTAQSEGEQKLDQTIQLTIQPTKQIHSTNILDQGNQTVVTTESIGVPSADYVRYNSIKTEQKNAAGKDFDFSQVLGTWGKLVADDQQGSAPQLFNQTVLGVVPMANLTRAQKADLLALMKKNNVYKYTYKADKNSTVMGHKSYTYDVEVDPVAYINLLKTFAKNDLQMNDLDSVDAEQYAGTAALQFEFKIDVLSGQLTEVTYKDSDRKETYSAYGAKVAVPVPRNTIDLGELQARLQQIQ
jgi:hypothetical protein